MEGIFNKKRGLAAALKRALPPVLAALFLLPSLGPLAKAPAAELVVEAPETASRAWLPVLGGFLSGPSVAAAAPWNAPGGVGDSPLTRLGRMGVFTPRGAAAAQPLIGTLASAGISPSRFQSLSDDYKKALLAAAVKDTQTRLSAQADALLDGAAEEYPSSQVRTLGRFSELGSVYLDPARLGRLLVAHENAKRREAIARQAGALAGAFAAPLTPADETGASGLEARYQEGLSRFALSDTVGKARWIKLFAEAGVPDAQIQLGIIYQTGQGLRKDLTAGHAWILRAAESGFVPAMNMLAYQYKMGFATEEDPVEAYAWYSLAQASGDRGASPVMLAELAAHMTPAQLSHAKSRAQELAAGFQLSH